METRVRAATVADVAALVEFNVRLAQETENRELDRPTVERGVAAVFARPGLAAYRVAEAGGRTVGCLMLTYEWSDWRNGLFWWIQSVYVAPEARRQGVFTALFREVEQEARRDPGCCGLRLYVEEHNRSAQATYAKLGLEMTNYRLQENDFRQRSAPATCGRP